MYFAAGCSDIYCWLLEMNVVKVIDVERSCVELLGSKAELKLKKADPISWASLELKTQKSSGNQEATETRDNE